MRAFRSVVPAILAALLVAALGGPAPVAASESQSVVEFARSQIGKPYKYGTTGLATYDCSGLVYRTFAATDLLDRIGGRRMTSRGYFNWFVERGRVTGDPRPGDLVVWGNPVSHIGIYSGRRDGHPMAVSALTSGVKEHRVHAVTTKFRAYLHVELDGQGGTDAAVGSSSDAKVGSSTLPAPFNSTMNLRKGSHTLYRINSSGSVITKKTIQRSRSLTVEVDPDVSTFGGRPHAQIESGTWADWWRRVPDAAPSCCLSRFPTNRTLRLGSGRHLFKSFHASNTVVLRDHLRVDGPTYLKVDRRATFNGRRHFRIADGPMAGLWVIKSSNSYLVP